MKITNILWWIKMASVFLMNSSRLDGGKFCIKIVPAKIRFSRDATLSVLLCCVH